MPENKDQLTSILTYHVVRGFPAKSSDLSDNMSIMTLEGSGVTSMVTGGVKINNANVVSADIEATNGVIHVIDTVLMPPSTTSSSTSSSTGTQTMTNTGTSTTGTETGTSSTTGTETGTDTQTGTSSSTTGTQPLTSIAEIASADPRFSTLVSALS